MQLGEERLAVRDPAGGRGGCRRGRFVDCGLGRLDFRRCRRPRPRCRTGGRAGCRMRSGTGWRMRGGASRRMQSRTSRMRRGTRRRAWSGGWHRVRSRACAGPTQIQRRARNRGGTDCRTRLRGSRRAGVALKRDRFVVIVRIAGTIAQIIHVLCLQTEVSAVRHESIDRAVSAF